jgi:P4 family phage/plasmid primase-like protien
MSLVELAKKLSRLGFEVEFFRDDGARAEDVSQAKVIGIKLGPEKPSQNPQFYLISISIYRGDVLKRSDTLRDSLNKTVSWTLPTCPFCYKPFLVEHDKERYRCANCNYVFSKNEVDKITVALFSVDEETFEDVFKSFRTIKGSCIEISSEGYAYITSSNSFRRGFLFGDPSKGIYPLMSFELKKIVEDLRLVVKPVPQQIASEADYLANILGVSKELVVKILKAKKSKMKGGRFTKIASLVVAAVLDHFEYVKNFTYGGADLGLHCWDEVRYKLCEADIETWIEKLYQHLKLEESGIKFRDLINEVMKRLEAGTRECLQEDPSGIAFENCVWNWDTLRCEEHNPDKVVLHHIPYPIDVDVLKELMGKLEITESDVAKHAPKTLKAFEEWVGSKWILLFELIGFVLYPKPYKKAVLLTDAEGREGDTGKSTYIRYLQRILERDNYTSVTLQALTNPEQRFQAALIYGKLANFYADLPEKAVKDVGAFKVITGEDTITIERKYRDPFTWRPYTKHIFSANIPPPVSQADNAWWRRWLVIEFYGDFKEVKKEFEKTLENEIPKAIAIGIAAFHKVLQRGRFSYEDTSEDARFKWLSRVDSVFAFMEWAKNTGVLKPNQIARIPIDKLYNIYTRYCDYQDRDPVERRAFTLRLQSLGYSTKRPQKKSVLVGFELDESLANKLLSEEE